MSPAQFFIPVSRSQITKIISKRYKQKGAMDGILINFQCDVVHIRWYYLMLIVVLGGNIATISS